MHERDPKRKQKAGPIKQIGQPERVVVPERNILQVVDHEVSTQIFESPVEGVALYFYKEGKRAYKTSNISEVTGKPQTLDMQAEAATPENELETRKKENEFRNFLNAHRKELGADKDLVRIEVLDVTGHIQARFLSENRLPLTHVTDDKWFKANYPQATAATGVEPAHRTRNRARAAVHETTKKIVPDYSQVGCVELLVAGTDDPQVAFNALMASPYHRPAMENLDYKDIGIYSKRATNGVMYWSIVLGRGDTKNTWAPSKRAMVYQTYAPAVINNS